VVLNKWIGWMSAGVVLVVLVALPAGEAEAVPAFARKYNVSCALCHNPAPRLTAVGEQFAANGFQFALDEEPVDTVDTGDAQLLLLEQLPLAVRFDAYVRGDTRSGTPGSDLQTPWAIKLLSGGQIARKVSYYLYFFMSERGEVAGLEDAYVQFSDLLGSGVDLLVGQFQVSDPLFKRELRLQYEDYQPYRVRVGEARADLTYDRGLMAAYSPWEGGDVSLQLVNGQGLDHSSAFRIYDRDHGKNLAAHAAQEFGPMRVGAFGYWGRESVDGVASDIRIFGPDATFSLGRTLEVSGQYLRRLDDQPFFASGGPSDTEVDMGFLELVWSPQGATGRWFFTGLYNHIRADQPIFTIRQGEPGFLERYRSAALGGNYMLARNLRLTSELLYDLDHEDMRFVAGFMSAF
jgi:hypothetical protein